MNKTIEVSINENEKYPDYALTTKEQFKRYCDFAIETDGITDLPVSLYRRFKNAQNKYETVENELEVWIKNHPKATRYTRNKEIKE
jgi:hypothetical protein